MRYLGGLPKTYLEHAKRMGRKPIDADWAVMLVSKGRRPAIVPGSFTTEHLDKLPDHERKRWLKTSRRRVLDKKRKRASAS